MAKIPCPCDPKREYSTCCERFHRGTLYPTDPETLMRSRYSAYVLALIDYLQRTWHTASCPQTLNAEPSIKWLGLKICQVTQDEHQNECFVEFIARFKDSAHHGQADKIHEVSRFIHENGRLVYMDGTFK